MNFKENLALCQSLPLEEKISRFALPAIREFIDRYGTERIYVSFSGGKDSLMLADLIYHNFEPIKLTYCKTPLEDPRITDFVYRYADSTGMSLDIIEPEKSLLEVLNGYGFCFPSKDVAQIISALRKPNPPIWARNKIEGLDSKGHYSEFRQQYRKWWWLIDADVPISDACAQEFKIKPFKKYEALSGRKPIVATQASESERRKSALLRGGMNTYEDSLDENGNVLKNPRPMSRPLSYFTKEDILLYLYSHKIELAPPYGEYTIKNFLPGQTCLFCPERGDISLTGAKRTGCLCCAVGAHLNNFEKVFEVKTWNPELFSYIWEECNMKKLYGVWNNHKVNY